MAKKKQTVTKIGYIVTIQNREKRKERFPKKIKVTGAYGMRYLRSIKR